MVTKLNIPLTLFIIAFLLIPTLGITQSIVDTVGAGKPIDKSTYDNITTFTQGVDWIYGLLIILTGYLSPYIPFIKTINRGVYRVLAAAVVLGVGFYFGAGSNVLNLFITYTISTSVYELALKQQNLLKKVTP